MPSVNPIDELECPRSIRLANSSPFTPNHYHDDSHAGGQVQQFVSGFLQIHAHDFHLFILLLAVLAVAYRNLGLIVLMVRVRYIGKEH